MIWESVTSLFGKKMHLEYTANKESTKCAAKKHFDYKWPIRRVVEPIIGLLLIIYGFYFIFTSTDAVMASLGGGILGLGAVFMFRREIYSSSASRNAFKGKPDSMLLKIEVIDDGLKIIGETAESVSQWKSFVDYHLSDAGVLLYPQHNFFMWVPSDAIFSEGDWLSFIAVLELNLKKAS